MQSLSPRWIGFHKQLLVSSNAVFTLFFGATLLFVSSHSRANCSDSHFHYYYEDISALYFVCTDVFHPKQERANIATETRIIFTQTSINRLERNPEKSEISVDLQVDAHCKQQKIYVEDKKFFDDLSKSAASNLRMKLATTLQENKFVESALLNLLCSPQKKAETISK